jgi:YfiH family protein
MIDLAAVEPVPAFEALGVRAFTTTRQVADFAIAPDGPTAAEVAVWTGLMHAVGAPVQRLASATQVHGTRVVQHATPFDGWLRVDGADGHLSAEPGTALAITIADCVPVFLAHPSGHVGVVHAGWRGVAGGILPRALEALGAAGCAAADTYVHLGPAISGRAYEVSPDVFETLTGWSTVRPRQVDLRALLAEQAREAGVRHLSVSPWCTREDNDRFYSHRAGDAGRQVAVIMVPSAPVGLP